MARKHLPQQRKNALVGKDGLPRWLDPARRGFGEPCAERLVKRPFPGIEFERGLDFAGVAEIDEAAVVAPSDRFDIEQGGLNAALPRGVLEIGQGAGILGVLGHPRQMQVASGSHLLPRLDQPFMDRVELVGTGGNDVPLDSPARPGPLKNRRLEDRGRCVGIILQQFRRTPPVKIRMDQP